MTYRGSRWVAALASLALLIGGLAALSPGSALAAGQTISVGSLTTNGRVDPLGIPGGAPTFGWASASPARGVVQGAYEVEVGSEIGGNDVWSSGKVDSDEQVNVDYAGPSLKSQTRYFWRVRVWDGKNAASGWSTSAWFETGILDSSEWAGDWIDKSASGELDKWANYTVDVDFSLKSLSFGVFFRASNASNNYMWQVNTETSVVRLRPHIRTAGSWTALPSVDVPESVITKAELLTESHTISIKASGSTVTTLLDGTQIDTRTVAAHPHGYVGIRTNVAAPKDEHVLVHQVTVTSESGTTLLDTDFADGNPFTAGTIEDGSLTVAGNAEALWRSPDANKPLLRTEFDTTGGKEIKSARAYASARGNYELTLNGKKVGDQFLAPGFTEYPKRIQSQTYDVTDLVNEGHNAFGGLLGDGWWAGKVGMFGAGVYGTQLSLIAQLRIDYTDGTSQVIATDDTWKGHSGPYIAADTLDGEAYDARQEQPGWDNPGFDDSGWPAAVVRTSATAQLSAQPDEPIRDTAELAAKQRTEPAEGASVYDFGQNLSGVARVRLHGVAGQKVRLRYAEVLTPGTGTLYTANLRTAKATDYYTFKATGTVVYEPKFAFHGFRYLEITGASEPPALDDVTAVVWGSDLRKTGEFETSSAMLNQLQSNITWGQRSNFLSVPTDTPARDERLGWTGDINVFAPTAAFNMDSRAFLGKWMTDIRDAQFSSGDVPTIAPQPAAANWGAGGTGWSDATITVPYAVYQAYGDTRTVRTNYATMKKYLDYIVAATGPSRISSRHGNGDWVNLGDPTPDDYLGTVYLAETARMLAEMASAIDKNDDAATYTALAADVREKLAERFISDDGKVSNGSQTAYAMALGMDLVPANLRDKVAGRYEEKIVASGDHLLTGFLGTPWLLPGLSSSGKIDKAFELLVREDYPSWGYEIANGATTMWERWDGIKPDGTYQDPGMNSFNHYANGAVGDWMYKNIAGLQTVKPGYKVSRIAPQVGGGLTHARGAVDSVYGKLSSAWRVTDTGFTLDVEVPVNTTSEVQIPSRIDQTVLESGTPAAEADGVTGVDFAGGVASIKLGSGSYRFSVTDAAPPVVLKPAPVASQQPVVSGAAKVGRKVTASAGTWDVDGVALTYRWLRNGVPIGSGTSNQYVAKTTDVGARLSVQVTAAKDGYATGTATSRTTATVKKATSSVSRTLSAKSIKSGHKVTVKVKVRATGIVPSGKVDIYYRGKRVRTGLKLVGGKLTTTFRPEGKGKRSLRIVYRGNSGVSGSTSTIKLTVR